jgi:hypothetical protein
MISDLTDGYKKILAHFTISGCLVIEHPACSAETEFLCVNSAWTDPVSVGIKVFYSVEIGRA